MAFFRGPILSRVLSVWAENLYGSSLGQDKALTKFSAQTDSTRLRIGPWKNAKIDFFRKWPKSYFLRFFAKKGKFWALFWKNCIGLLVSLFWPFLCLLSNLFGLSKFSTQNRHFLRIFSRGDASKNHEFVGFFEGSCWVQTNCWKCTF